MSHVTLEQQRAADAWKKAQGCNSGYRNLAKGLPALIMNSGLMQVLAFLHEKGSKSSQAHCKDLGEHMRQWLQQRYPKQLASADFAPFMQGLMKAQPQLFQQISTEALAWLRWSRQMAAAVCTDKGD